jgi:hypothetical protein
MVFAAVGIDYEGDLATIRSKYISATPRQRLSIIRQRLDDHHFGPNHLVTAVSAVEGLSRSLAMHAAARRKSEFENLYPKYSYRKPEGLIREYLQSKGISDPAIYFSEDTWRLFGYAVKYRNLVAHECTYLGLEKFPSLIQACEEVLSALVKLGRIPESSR